MRLVYFDFTNNFGGAPQSMAYLAERLAREHEVHVLDAYGRCAAYREALQAAGVPYRALLPEARWIYIGHAGIRRLWAFLRQLPELLRLRARAVKAVRTLDPDMIWVMGAKSLAIVGTSWRLRRYPIALLIRGWGSAQEIKPWLHWLMWRRAAAVLAVSTATVARLQQAGVPAHKLHLGSSSIDVPKVLRRAEEPLGRELPGGGLTPKILLIAARPTREKGHLTAVRALARLKQAGYAPALWLPGKPAVGASEQFVLELRRLAEELHVDDSVFLLGWIENVAALIRASDIAILPSQTEGLPRSVLEAMVLRRPVVATPVGGVVDCIADGRTGLLVPVDDDAALARGVQRLLENPRETAQMVERAHQHVLDSFDPDQYTRRTADIFASVARTRVGS